MENGKTKSVYAKQMKDINDGEGKELPMGVFAKYGPKNKNTIHNNSNNER